MMLPASLTQICAKSDYDIYRNTTRWFLQLCRLLCLCQHVTSQIVHFEAYLTPIVTLTLDLFPQILMHSS